MRTTLGIALAMMGCTSSTEQKLPTASFTPHLNSQPSAVACGEDVAFYGNPSPDLRYLFTYDAAGRLTHADGNWANNGPTDTVDYTWAGDNLTHMVSVSGWDGSEYEVTASYDASNSLLDYTWAWTDGTDSDAVTYTYSSFVGVGQPTRVDAAYQGDPSAWGYTLGYDASGRLITAVEDGGSTTTWTYDDSAGTIASTTDNGAFSDLLTYDADYRLLSVAWTGTDPSSIDGEEVYAWTGDQLDTVTFRSGSEQAPHQLQLVRTDTLRYDCTAARTHAGKTSNRHRVTTRRMGTGRLR